MMKERANNKTSTTHYKGGVLFLGFHPYKEIVFLMVYSLRFSFVVVSDTKYVLAAGQNSCLQLRNGGVLLRGVVVSYHLNSSKVQELVISDAYHMDISFPYTPSWMEFAISLAKLRLVACICLQEPFVVTL
jgi:hypothetical protein